MTSPKIARPLTLRTKPSDYATFNQINYFLLFNIGLLLERERNSKKFSLYAFIAEQGWIPAKIGNVLTVNSNDIGFLSFTSNQVIDEINC